MVRETPRPAKARNEKKTYYTYFWVKNKGRRVQWSELEKVKRWKKKPYLNNAWVCGLSFYG